jgi:DNA-binding PadR family transcriptional regulator
MTHPLYDSLPEQRIIDNVEALRGYFDPLRQRIMQTIGRAPMTVQALAQHLEVPFTRLYYHMHFLEKHGFIQQIDSHSYGGAVEQKVYYITAKTFVLDRRLLSVLKDDGDDALEAVLETTLDDTRTDIRASARLGIIDLSQRVPHPQAALMLRGLFRFRPEQATVFQERIKALIKEMLEAEVESKEAQEGETPAFYSLALAFYPSAHMKTPEEQEE